MSGFDRRTIGVYPPLCIEFRPSAHRGAFSGSPVVLRCESNEIFPPSDTLVARRLREARVSFHKEKKEEITIREENMGSSRLSRRAVLKTAALGSAAVITAPYVSGVHAAGTLTLGCWDHWVPGANKALDKICKEWGDKNKVDIHIDYITSQGEKDKLTAAAGTFRFMRACSSRLTTWSRNSSSNMAR
jgi:hypothetical protein